MVTDSAASCATIIFYEPTFATCALLWI